MALLPSTMKQYFFTVITLGLARHNLVKAIGLVQKIKYIFRTFFVLFAVFVTMSLKTDNRVVLTPKAVEKYQTRKPMSKRFASSHRRSNMKCTTLPIPND